jgi:hypothetical protein
VARAANPWPGPWCPTCDEPITGLSRSPRGTYVQPCDCDHAVSDEFAAGVLRQQTGQRD